MVGSLRWQCPAYSGIMNDEGPVGSHGLSPNSHTRSPAPELLSGRVCACAPALVCLRSAIAVAATRIGALEPVTDQVESMSPTCRVIVVTQASARRPLSLINQGSPESSPTRAFHQESRRMHSAAAAPEHQAGVPRGNLQPAERTMLRCMRRSPPVRSRVDRT